MANNSVIQNTNTRDPAARAVVPAGNGMAPSPLAEWAAIHDAGQGALNRSCSAFSESRRVDIHVAMRCRSPPAAPLIDQAVFHDNDGSKRRPW